jgi:hypothetical protein
VEESNCYAPGPGCDALPPPTCDAGPLPPGCDCICHQSCHGRRAENNYSVGENSKYEASITKNEIYEMK